MQEELAHYRDQGNFARFASLPQVLMEASVDSFPPNLGHSRHIQRLAHYGTTYYGTTAPERPLTALVATVPRPRSELHQRRQRLAVSWAPCGQKGHQYRRRQRSRPRYTAVQIGLSAQVNTALQQSLVLLIQPCYLLVEPTDMPLGRLTDGGPYALIPPVPFLDPLFETWPAPTQPL